MIYFCTFELAAKDRETLLKSIGKESYRSCIDNMSYLDESLLVAKKFARRTPEMTKEELNMYL